MIIDLPFPISVNAMFKSIGKRRAKSQRYREWCEEAGWALASQRPQPIKGQFTISYLFREPQDRRERDCFNLEKGVTDLLVEHGIIEGDSNRYLRKGTVEWSSEVEGVRIEITPIKENENE